MLKVRTGESLSQHFLVLEPPAGFLRQSKGRQQSQEYEPGCNQETILQSIMFGKLIGIFSQLIEGQQMGMQGAAGGNADGATQLQHEGIQRDSGRRLFGIHR